MTSSIQSSALYVNLCLLSYNIQRIEHYLKEGRGQGRGKDYKPWLQIQDLPSRGLTTRIKGWKTGRKHHLFSKLETSVFLYFRLVIKVQSFLLL